MFTLIRKNQQALMIIVTVLVIIAFAWLYNSTDLDKLSQTTMGSIYGKTLTSTEFQRRNRMINLASSLGFQELLRGLSAAATRQEDVVINSIILDHQADELQIHPTDVEVAAVLKTLPVFQTDGQFDFAKYGEFIENSLAPNGFTESQLEESVKTQIRYTTLRSLVGSATVLPNSAARDYWSKGNNILHCSIIRINKDAFEAKVTISEEEISKYFESHQDTLNTEEQRQLQLVRLELSEEQAKLTGPDRIKELQIIANQAGDLAEKVLVEGSNFEAIVTESNLKITTTSLFTGSAPDADLAKSRALSGAAFTLSEDAPTSDPLQDGDGFVIMHLVKTVPSRPLTLDEAREEITASLKEDKTREAMEAHAKGIRDQLVTALAGNQDIAAAATAAGVIATQLPPFSLSKPDMKMPDWMSITRQSMELEEGQMSDFFTTETGGALLCITKVEPGDEAEFDKVKASFTTRLRSQKQQLAWSEWITAGRAQAKMKFAQSE